MGNIISIIKMILFLIFISFIISIIVYFFSETKEPYISWYLSALMEDFKDISSVLKKALIVIGIGAVIMLLSRDK